MATLDNLKPANHDITYYSNDEFDLSITVTDEDGNAPNLSGHVISMTIKLKKTDSNAVQTLTAGSEITIGGASNNVLTFEGNYDLDERSYYYDIYDATSEETIMYGKFIVTGKVH